MIDGAGELLFQPIADGHAGGFGVAGEALDIGLGEADDDGFGRVAFSEIEMEWDECGHGGKGRAWVEGTGSPGVELFLFAEVADEAADDFTIVRLLIGLFAEAVAELLQADLHGEAEHFFPGNSGIFCDIS